MKISLTRRGRRASLWALAIVLAAFAGWNLVARRFEPRQGTGADSNTPPEPTVSSINREPGANPLAPSLRAYLDPVTGQWVTPPPGLRRPLILGARTKAALATSHDGLFQEELPSGGYKVDLQGRFRSALVAHVDEDGNIVLSHEPLPAEARPEVEESTGGQ